MSDLFSCSSCDAERLCELCFIELGEMPETGPTRPIDPDENPYVKDRRDDY